MEEAKRKEIESQLQRLMGDAAHNRTENSEKRLRLPGGIRVIRRRKGCADRHLLATCSST